ncbi:MAG TPA: DcrB-related protein [Minicystis sp.]|nr:DcrB-related protein [Minicystis sp.]
MSAHAGPFAGLAADVYCTNDLAFALPELAWIDRTVHTLEAPTSNERTCSLVVARAPLAPRDDLNALVTRALRRAGREKPEHELLRRTERTIAGRPGIDVAVRWRAPRSTLYGRQAHVTAGGVWLVFGITGSLEDAATCDHHLERLVETLRLRT